MHTPRQALLASETVICMTTHNRTDCAKINQEIIKLNYKLPFKIVHACSNLSYEPELEDLYLQLEPKPLQQGALSLLQSSIVAATKAFSPRYIIHLEADTWIMRERILHRILEKLDGHPEAMLCTSSWSNDLAAFEYLRKRTFKSRLRLAFARLARVLGNPIKLDSTDSLATQFFIMRTNHKVLECIQAIRPAEGLDLEHMFFIEFMSRFGKKNILYLKQREPLHPFNRYVCNKLSLYSQHWPARGFANDPRDTSHPYYVPPCAEGKRRPS